MASVLHLEQPVAKLKLSKRAGVVQRRFAITSQPDLTRTKKKPMQHCASPFHRQSDRDAYVPQGARIPDFIRNAQAGRDILQLQLKQWPLQLIPHMHPAPICASPESGLPGDAEAVPATPSGLRVYDPAPLANTLIAQAQAAIEQLGRSMIANEEREKQLRLCLSEIVETSEARPSLDDTARSAVAACLASAAALLDVTRTIYNRLPDPTPQERVIESKALAELTKAAGRAAYRAALLIVDPEFQPVPLAAPN